MEQGRPGRRGWIALHRFLSLPWPIRTLCSCEGRRTPKRPESKQTIQQCIYLRSQKVKYQMSLVSLHNKPLGRLLMDVGERFQCRSSNYRTTLKSKSDVPCTGYARRKNYNCDVCNFTESTPRTVGWHKKAKHAKISP